jgi:hypothetical protein
MGQISGGSAIPEISAEDILGIMDHRGDAFADLSL